MDLRGHRECNNKMAKQGKQVAVCRGHRRHSNRMKTKYGESGQQRGHVEAWYQRIAVIEPETGDWRGCIGEVAASLVGRIQRQEQENG